MPEDITSDLMDKLQPFATATKYVGDLVGGVKSAVATPRQKGPVDSKALLDRNTDYAKQRKAGTVKSASPKMTAPKGGKR